MNIAGVNNWSEEEIIDLIKGLSIHVDQETNDFMSTDASTHTRLTITLKYGDDVVSETSLTV
jgi:hypothetical protein